MGLCKCPKKKVTNLFCFEHRVNVCEHCLVANHNKCIVQSYLQWLQDSDYNPNCTFCNQTLSDENGECVRLTCYDVFHFECLSKYGQSLPANTAPAGYTCPVCKAGIIPPPNMVSPVAESLRKVLSRINWARPGLGLPIIEDTERPPAANKPTTESSSISESSPITPDVSPVKPQNAPLVNTGLVNLSTLGASPMPNTSRPSAQVSPYNSTPNSKGSSSTGKHVHGVINVDAGTTARGLDKPHPVADPRKLFDSTKEDILNLTHDHDDDKYKRRPALDWLNRWLRSRDGGPKLGNTQKKTSMQKRFLIVLLIGLIGFLTLIVIFSMLGRRVTEDDPFLDPMANPNIRVNDQQDVF